MRTLFLNLILIIFIQNKVNGQGKYLNEADFFSPFTLIKMRGISDSLHNLYNSSPHNKSYWSLPQAHGNWVFMDSMAYEAKDFLKTKPTFEAFVKKFPFAKTEKNMVVLRNEHEGYSNGKFVQFRTSPEVYPYEFDLKFDSKLLNSTLKNEWLDTILLAHQYRPHDEFVACFFEKGFEKQLLPDNYVKQIQYVDFLADTNTVLFIPSLRMSEKEAVNTPLPARQALYALVFPRSDDHRDGDFNYDIDYFGTIEINDTLVSKLSITPEFKKRLIAASDEALIKKVPSIALELLVSKYLSPVKGLQIMRLRNIRSSCGNDNTPRVHFYNIAKLAAANGNWKIFMKSYLTLLSYPFDGVNNKQLLHFYTNELELLNINVNDLYLGACLNIDNRTPNHNSFHYASFSVCSPIGASSQFETIEKNLLKAIADTHLDNYNRYHYWDIYDNIIAAELYLDKAKANKNLLKSKRNKAKALLPVYIASRIKNEEQ